MDFKETGNYFKVQTANEWIEESKLKPMPKKLFSEFWYEGELCILFADTNVGKSILAVQIADSISRGIPINGFDLEAEAQTVLYFDLELNSKQFEIRYSDENGTLHHVWSDKFMRVEIDSDYCPENGLNENFVIDEIERLIIEKGAPIMIFDNISFMNTDNEKTKEAGGLMRKLKRLKQKHNLTILVLAHTPKRDSSRPITVNDLAGSKMLANFADSIFCIGKDAKDSGLRYLKQIKQRNTEQIYGDDNVLLCRIEKKLNYLCLMFEGYGNEYDYLVRRHESDYSELIEECKRLKETGMSLRDIAEKLNINHMKVKRYLEK